MAEGDTIHRLAGRIETAIGGEILEAASVPAERSPLAVQTSRLESVVGGQIGPVEARGKHLLIGFDSGLTLHCHLGMNGSWGLARERAALRKPAARAWLLLETGVVVAAQWGGPHLALLTPAELKREPRLARLGPDLLDPAFDPADGALRLQSMAADRAIGDALLDQSILAGIGNVLKSEALWIAGLDPFAPVSAFGAAELTDLLQIEVGLMRESVSSDRRPQRIYRTHGRPCPRCGTVIRARGQGDANRTTYWCPACQQAGGQA